MKFDDLHSQGLIEKVEADLTDVKKTLTKTQRDLTTARANLDIDEE